MFLEPVVPGRLGRTDPLNEMMNGAPGALIHGRPTAHAGTETDEPALLANVGPKVALTVGSPPRKSARGDITQLETLTTWGGKRKLTPHCSTN